MSVVIGHFSAVSLSAAGGAGAGPRGRASSPAREASPWRWGVARSRSAGEGQGWKAGEGLLRAEATSAGGAPGARSEGPLRLTHRGVCLSGLRGHLFPVFGPASSPAISLWLTLSPAPSVTRVPVAPCSCHTGSVSGLWLFPLPGVQFPPCPLGYLLAPVSAQFLPSQ